MTSLSISRWGQEARQQCWQPRDHLHPLFPSVTLPVCRYPVGPTCPAPSCSPAWGMGWGAPDQAPGTWPGSGEVASRCAEASRGLIHTPATMWSLKLLPLPQHGHSSNYKFILLAYKFLPSKTQVENALSPGIGENLSVTWERVCAVNNEVDGTGSDRGAGPFVSAWG